MLFHVSIEADDPHHVATVIAEFWRGAALPFPPVSKGSWIAMAGDDRGTCVEVYPRGTELREADGMADAIGVDGLRRLYNPTHIALATPLERDDALAIARREGWPAKICNRGGAFHVIEMWIEGCQMVELLTPEMQREYLGAVTIENWEAMLAATMTEAA
jgi:hypothetical protein